MRTFLLLLILSPLCGSLLLVALGRYVHRRTAEGIACASVLSSLVMAITAFITAGQESYTITLFDWFRVGSLSATMSVYYDPLAAIMGVMVTFVSSLIHIYSVAFMRDEKDYVRYFCYLNLFVCAMVVICLADNLAFLYLGWEGVGFCSYALIGFWYSDVVKAAAGRKAFLLTRIGDVALGIAIALFFLVFNTLSISRINSHTELLSGGTATVLGLLMLWAAVGKSAQLPLTVWLPDAMAGPTPVSALIHAATMVTAGVYLLMRVFPVIYLSPLVLFVIAVVGAFTALYAACSALAQKDIKRVLAYSTISQVGYMVLGVGAGDISASMFHLLSHAFFKSLLFMAAGCIIQALHEEHDIFKMGGLYRRMPAVFFIFLAGALSLAALPPSGGFFSKDRILMAVFVHREPLYLFLGVVATVTALLTSLYTFRLFFLVFLGSPDRHNNRSVLPIPRLMVWTLYPLALLSLCGEFLNLPTIWRGGEWLAAYLAPVSGSVQYSDTSTTFEWAVELGGSVLSLAGLVLAYLIYRPGALIGVKTRVSVRKGLYEFFECGFYLDRLYQRLFARPYQGLAAFSWHILDEATIDAGLVRTAKVFPLLSIGARLLTSGRLSLYLKMLFTGFAVILGILFMGWYFS